MFSGAGSCLPGLGVLTWVVLWVRIADTFLFSTSQLGGWGGIKTACGGKWQLLPAPSFAPTEKSGPGDEANLLPPHCQGSQLSHIALRVRHTHFTHNSRSHTLYHFSHIIHGVYIVGRLLRCLLKNVNSPVLQK